MADDVCYGCVGAGLGGCPGFRDASHPTRKVCVERKAELERKAKEAKGTVK